MSRAIVLLVAFLGAVWAAPQHYHHRGPFHSHTSLRNRNHEYSPFQDEYFDTNAFWSELSREMAEFDRALQEFTRRFPTSSSNEGVEGAEYKISIPLTGFQEKDIVVKAREGVLMIQAIHKKEEGSENHYLDVRTLPSYVNVSGSWTYDNSILKIVFPVTGTLEVPQRPDFETTEPASTLAPESDEQMETTNNSEHVPDADVGLDKSVDDRVREILTNEISGSNVEATTYAVDLKNEVEFVPVRY